jgi:PleD family two-component response regulator
MKQVFSRVDAALYEAKNGGRNRTVQSGLGSSEDEGYA